MVEPSPYWATIEHPNVTYRVYPTYERWVDWWNSVIQDTLAPIPTASRASFVVEQRHSPYLSQLGEEFGYSTPEGEAISQRGSDLSVSTEFERRDTEQGDTRADPVLAC